MSSIKLNHLTKFIQYAALVLSSFLLRDVNRLIMNKLNELVRILNQDLDNKVTILLVLVPAVLRSSDLLQVVTYSTGEMCPGSASAHDILTINFHTKLLKAKTACWTSTVLDGGNIKKNKPTYCTAQ